MKKFAIIARPKEVSREANPPPFHETLEDALPFLMAAREAHKDTHDVILVEIDESPEGVTATKEVPVREVKNIPKG